MIEVFNDYWEVSWNLPAKGQPTRAQYKTWLGTVPAPNMRTNGVGAVYGSRTTVLLHEVRPF